MIADRLDVSEAPDLRLLHIIADSRRDLTIASVVLVVVVVGLPACRQTKLAVQQLLLCERQGPAILKRQQLDGRDHRACVLAVVVLVRLLGQDERGGRGDDQGLRLTDRRHALDTQPPSGHAVVRVHAREDLLLEGLLPVDLQEFRELRDEAGLLVVHGHEAVAGAEGVAGDALFALLVHQLVPRLEERLAQLHEPRLVERRAAAVRV